MKNIFKFLVIAMIFCFLLISCNSDPESDSSADNKNGESSEGESSGNSSCAHTFGDWVVIKYPTCANSNGERIRTCTKCGMSSRELYSETVAHDFGEWEVFLPGDCIISKELRRECNNCDYEERDVIQSRGYHSFGESFTFSFGDCSKPEVVRSICSDCGTFEDVIGNINPQNHADYGRYTVPGKDNSPHLHSVLCLECNAIVAQESHSLTKETVLEYPTYEKTGSKVLSCNCGYSEIHTIPKLEKLIPTYTVPSVITCYADETLSDVELPLGFAFELPASTSVGTVGQRVFKARYTAPNDTEGKYETVYGIDITLSVEKRPITLSPSFACLDGLVYTGRDIEEKFVDAEYVSFIDVEWYSDGSDEPLEKSPLDVGGYTVKLSFESDIYEAETTQWTYSFNISKNANILDTLTLDDKIYDGAAYSPALGALGESAELSFKVKGLSDKLAAAPSAVGDYILEISVPDTSNYAADTKTFEISVYADTEKPVWSATVPQYLFDTNTLVVSASDNVGIAYYVYRRTDIQMWRTSTSSSITLENGYTYYIYAVDLSGNQTQLRSVGIRIPTGYAPTMSPADGSEITENYATLNASGAHTYYIGTTAVIDEMTETDSIAEGLKNGVTYYWCASDGVEYSEIYSFTVSCTEKDGVIPLYPSNGETVNDFGFYLNATSDNEIVNYYYSPANRENLDELVFSKSSDGYVQRLNYAVKYYWYAEDSEGNKSELSSFTYGYAESHNPEGIKVKGERVEYTRYGFITLLGEATAGVQYFRYYVVLDGEELEGIVNWSTAILHYSDGVPFANVNRPFIKGASDNTGLLKNNDAVWYHLVDGNYSYGEYRVIYVDTEAPVIASVQKTVTADGYLLTLPTATDNFGAYSYYRVNGGEWTLYDEETEIEVTGLSVIELRAEDYAGNVSEYCYTVGEAESNPKIEVLSGELGKYVNTDVVVRITPDAEEVLYLTLGDDVTEINGETEYTFSAEGSYTAYLCKKNSSGELEYISALEIRIDKTKPSFGEIYYFDTRYNLNDEYEYIAIDSRDIVDATLCEVYYCMRDVDKGWVELYDGRVQLYGYYLSKSGTYTVDIKLVDEAGNECIRSVDLLVDVKGPTIGGLKIDKNYDKDTDTTSHTVKVFDIVDDYGYYSHMHFQIWDEEAYLSGGESIVSESFFTEIGEREYVYDMSSLPDGTYYMLAYVVDNFKNATYSNAYYYVKYNTSDEVVIDGFVFIRTDNGYELTKYTGDDTELVLPDSVNGSSYVVGDHFLMNNSTVTAVKIGSLVTAIEWNAFRACKSLEAVILSQSVSSIGAYAFLESSISAVYYEGSEEEYKAITTQQGSSLPFDASKVYYYSENEPAKNSDNTSYVGNYWKYGEGNIPTVWTLE